MTISADEFLRRFLLHVLPKGFNKIRYFGFLGSRYRAAKLQMCRKVLKVTAVHRARSTDEILHDMGIISIQSCPICGSDKLSHYHTVRMNN